MQDFSVVSEKNISKIGNLSKPSRMFAISSSQKEKFISHIENLNNYFLIYVRNEKDVVNKLEKEFIRVLSENSENVIDQLSKEPFMICCSWDLENESLFMILQEDKDSTISNYLVDCELNFGGHDEIENFDPKFILNNDEEISSLSEKEQMRLKQCLRTLVRY